jgi:ATP-dependent RNA helicase DHX36
MTNRLPPSLYVPPHQRLGSDYGFNPVPLSPVRYVSAYDDRVSEDRQPVNFFFIFFSCISELFD